MSPYNRESLARYHGGKYIVFDTKANNLKMLEGRLKSALVLPQISITLKDWEVNFSEVIGKIQAKKWDMIPLIVRSSAKNEDTDDASEAGKYESRLNVLGMENIILAVNYVMSSFEIYDEDNQVFLQPMLTDIKLSGVVFSVDPNNNGNYIIINYDDETKHTYSVTAGHFSRSYYFFKYADSVYIPEKYKKIIQLVFELEKVCGSNKLDIEFAVDTADRLYLLQVRPLVIKGEIADPILQKSILENTYKKIKSYNVKSPYLFGEKMTLSVMSDWNPAEMIGVKPRPLALSLYEELITDEVWVEQRRKYSYKDVGKAPLMITLAGTPFIDNRKSFNSFLPEGLDDVTGEKLVNYYLEQLIKNPRYHDKVEFQIVYSCFSFDLNEKTAKLKKFGFKEEEIDQFNELLKKITLNVLDDSSEGLLAREMLLISRLDKRIHEIKESNLDEISKVYHYIEECKNHGTLPFAGYARVAFIAVYMLQSLVTVNIMTNEEKDFYLNSLETVNSQMNLDLLNFGREEFLKKYGHLRPGTYDILSQSYEENPEKYFDFEAKKAGSSRKYGFRLSEAQVGKIEELLTLNHINISADQLFKFFKKAIEGREYCKFLFTKSINEILKSVIRLARKYNISREDISYVDIFRVKELYKSDRDIRMVLIQNISDNKGLHERELQISLPSFLYKPEQIWAFDAMECEPNYITHKKVVAKTAVVGDLFSRLEGSILLLPTADPGYDWIFSKKIAGFITMYGGANSHMAIRSNELAIPAVIGVGETLFRHYQKVERLEINCDEKIIRVLS